MALSGSEVAVVKSTWALAAPNAAAHGTNLVVKYVKKKQQQKTFK